MAGSASALWSDGAELACASGRAIARQATRHGNDDVEFRVVMVGDAASNWLDTGRLLCRGGGVVVEFAEWLTAAS